MEVTTSKIAEIEEQIREMKRINRTRGHCYKWTVAEVRRIAPYYKGCTEKFSLSLYIKSVKNRDLMPLQRQLEDQRQAEPRTPSPSSPMNNRRAAMLLFHLARPNPMHFKDEQGVLDVEHFKVELKVWLTRVRSLWITMHDTRHQYDCDCCITFKQVANNYYYTFEDEMFSSYEFRDKTVSKLSIIRWAEAVNDMRSGEALYALQNIARDLFQVNESRRFSNITTDSSDMTDAEDNDSYIVSTTSDQNKAEEEVEKQLQRCSESEYHSSRPFKRIRLRKSAGIPFETVSDIDETSEEISLAIPHMSKMVKIPKYADNIIGRDGYIRLAQNFFEQMMKASALMAPYEYMSKEKQTSRFEKEHANYLCVKRPKFELQDVRNVYTTRS